MLTYKKAEALLAEAGRLAAHGDVPKDAPIAFDTATKRIPKVLARHDYFYDVYEGSYMYLIFRKDNTPQFGEVGPIDLNQGQKLAVRHAIENGGKKL